MPLLEPNATTASNGASSDPAIIHLPAGMMGLPDVTRFELLASESNPPLLWLRSIGETSIHFPVVEPGPLVPEYKLQISEDDAETLGSASGTVPLVLNVLTVKSLSPQRATLNLVAPIVINRETLTGKQLVIENYERYSIEYPLIDESDKAAAC